MSGSNEKIRTSAGIEVKPVYTAVDIAPGLDERLAAPGEYPFTRGVHPLMYRSKVWTMRQYAGYATAQESNERYKLLVKEGVTGLSVAFDLPSQMGYDSDDPEIFEEVGRTGVAIDSLADMEILFDGIPLDRISTSFTINAVTPIILAMYLAAGEKQGVPSDKMTGTVQNDILKEYFARGAYIFPLRPSMRMIGDVFEYCAKRSPKFVPVSVCGYHIRETGANAVQEVAYAFLNAMAYIDNALERGLDIDAFASRVTFNFSAHMDLFEEVAKFRAARRLWAKLLREKYGAKDPKSWKFLYFAGTGGSTYTAAQPENNIIRGTIEALAIILGGCQALTVNTRDEGHAIPTAQAKLTALRTQQIIAYEAGVCSTVDPLGGSYYVEALTDQMEAEIVRAMEEIERRGGVIDSIESGYIQKLILREAVKTARDIDTGRKPLIGVNLFAIDEPPPEHLHEWDAEPARQQMEKLLHLKAGRDNAAVEAALGRLRQAALGNDNIVEACLEACKTYATLGEMTRVLKDVYGVFKEPLGVF